MFKRPVWARNSFRGGLVGANILPNGFSGQGTSVDSQLSRDPLKTESRSSFMDNILPRVFHGHWAEDISTEDSPWLFCG